MILVVRECQQDSGEPRDHCQRANCRLADHRPGAAGLGTRPSSAASTMHIRDKLLQAVERYNLLSPGDCVLVAVILFGRAIEHAVALIHAVSEGYGE